MKTMREFIQHRIESLGKKHSNAIPIFCGALLTYDEEDNFNFERFINSLAEVPVDSKFYNWHDTSANAMRTFCHICMVDPVIVETHLGMKFEELCKE